MRYSEPKIQELIEQLQGALDTLGCYQVRWMWRVDVSLGGIYRISGIAIWLTESKEFADLPIEEPKRLHFTLAVNLHSLYPKYWDDFKRNIVQQCVLIVQQCVLYIIKNAKPASEQDVHYMHTTEALGAKQVR